MNDLPLYLCLKIFGGIIYSNFFSGWKLLVPTTEGLPNMNSSRKDLILFIFSWHICISCRYCVITPQANKSIMAEVYSI